MRRFRNNDPPHPPRGLLPPVIGSRHHQRPSRNISSGKPKAPAAPPAGFGSSIVFLKKKTAQAVRIQALIRGFLTRKEFQQKLASKRKTAKVVRIQALIRGVLTRKKFQQKLAKYRRKQAKRRLKKVAAIRIQCYVRRYLIQQRRQLFVRRKQEYQAAKTIQALMRGVLQRHGLSSVVQKLELRLLQVQRKEQQDLERIAQDKRIKYLELDQILHQQQQQQLTAQRSDEALKAQSDQQQTLKMQLKSENHRLRHTIDRVREQTKQLKSHRRGLKLVAQTADDFQSTLQNKITELESNIIQNKKRQNKYEKVQQQMQAKLDQYVEKLGSEKRQQYIYVKYMDRLLDKVEVCTTTNGNQQQLMAHCLAIATDDEMAVQELEKQRLLQRTSTATNSKKKKQTKAKQKSYKH